MPKLRSITKAALVASSIPAVAATGYLATLTALSKAKEPPPRPDKLPFFDVIVPAHDEEQNIAATVVSLLAVEYPRNRFRVVVVADNCSDRTAERAREAGADVIERVDSTKRGKGYALHRAFEESLARGEADAVVVVDADTRVTKNLLDAFARRIAAGEVAVQAEYGVRNPDASWRTRLMVIAMSLFHTVRSNGRERLGVSCGLRGNGMAFSCDVLREVPHDAFSIVEDVEYGIRLGEKGHRVAYAAEAAVLGEMVSTSDAAKSQRQRWERGRAELAQKHGWRLVKRGIRERDAMLFDLGADLLVPPLSKIGLWIVIGVPASVVTGSIAIIPWSAAALMMGAYVARGVQLTRLGPRAVLDLAWAPVYVVWKLGLSASEKPSAWVRTTREKPQ
jgi:cellulose synthase/poly-beta-1,6-N-acetylglucosamine synthase-like glycosyltransferase